MLHSISWQAFFTAIAVVLALYYPTVILLFFRKEVQGMLRGRKNEISTHAGEEGNLRFALVHDLLEELKDVFHRAAKNHFTPEELTSALQEKLRHYRAKDTPLQESLTRHIREQCKKIGTELTEADRQRLW